MKKSIILAAIILFGLVTLSHAMVEVACFEAKTYIRDKGKPVPITDLFTSALPSGRLIITNGDPDDPSVKRVTAAWISLNGNQICDASDFNDNVSEFTIDVDLIEGDNTLEVFVKDPKDGTFTVRVVHDIDAEGAAIIGPAGGVVEVTDPESPIYGAKIEIPESTLDNFALFTISLAIQEIESPNGNITVSVPLEIKSSSDLNGYVKVTCPLNTLVEEDDLIVISYHNEGEDIWGFLPITEINSATSTVQFITDHFTIFYTQKVSESIPDEKLTEFDLQKDCFNEKFINDGDFQEYGFTDPKYQKGVCSGLANFALWHYLNYGHGLRCLWNEQHSAEIAIQSFDAIYYTHWKTFLSISFQFINAVGAKNLLLYSLGDLGTPVVLNMKGGGGWTLCRHLWLQKNC